MAQLTIGPVAFVDAEHPDDITFGGTQSLAVHDYVGGSRQVQSMGARESSITWEGYLRSSTAQARAIALDQLRISGTQVPLTFTQWSYDVVVQEFRAKIMHEFLIRYTIAVVVVRNKAAWAQARAIASVDAQIAGLYANANQGYTRIVAIAPAVIPAVQLPNLALQTAIRNAQPISSNPRAIPGILQAAQTAIAAMQTYMAGIKSPSNQQVAGANTYINAIQALVKNLGVAPAPLVLTKDGANLPKLAAQYYGNAALWPQLARANGFSPANPNIPSGVLTKISIPPMSSLTAVQT